MYDIDWRHWTHISNITTRIINKVSLHGVYQQWGQRCVARRKIPLWDTVGIPPPVGLSFRVRASSELAWPRVGWLLAVRSCPDSTPRPGEPPALRTRCLSSTLTGYQLNL